MLTSRCAPDAGVDRGFPGGHRRVAGAATQPDRARAHEPTEVRDRRWPGRDVTVGEIMGELSGGVFGDEGAEPLLGVTALESAGIEVDPQNQRLERLPATARIAAGMNRRDPATVWCLGDDSVMAGGRRVGEGRGGAMPDARSSVAASRLATAMTPAAGWWARTAAARPSAQATPPARRRAAAPAGFSNGATHIWRSDIVEP